MGLFDFFTRKSNVRVENNSPYRIFPNLLLSEMQIDGPLQCVVSDMTAFYVKGVYYELTLYMDCGTMRSSAIHFPRNAGTGQLTSAAWKTLLNLRSSILNTR